MREELSAAGGPARAPSDVTASLILDFLEWLTAGPRPYADVMEAWRTSCPRLTVWEDAIDAGYVARRPSAQSGVMVEITPRGRDMLAGAGRARLAAATDD